MAIIMACQCGKQLKVNDEFVGRRVKCPDCESVLTVPGGDERNAVTAGAPSRSASAAGGIIRFTCGCGKQMQAKSEFAGKKAKCPDCGAVLAIPGADPYAGRNSFDFDEQERVSDRQMRSRGRAGAAGEDFDQDAPRSRRQAAAGGKRRMWPWVAGIAAVLLLVGGGLAWFFIFRAKKTSPDLALVPRDAMGFVTIRLGDWLKSDSGKGIADELAKIPDIKKMEEKAGLGLKDIDRITIVFPNQDDPAKNEKEFWTIISTSKAVDEKKIRETMGKTEEKKVGEKAYYVSDKGAIHFVNSKIIVGGAPEGVKKFLESKPSTSGPLADSLQLAEDNKYHLVAGVQIPESLRQKIKGGMGGRKVSRPGMGGMGGGRMGGGGMGLGPDPTMFLELKSASLTAVLGNQTELDVRMTFSDSNTAKMVKEALDQVKQLAPLIMMTAKGKIPPGPEGAKVTEVLNKVEQTLKTLKVEQDGDTVHIPVKLDVDIAKSSGALLIPAIQKVREAASKTAMVNNLHQLGIGMHNYANAMNGQMPPQTFNKGLSWRVAILPYIEQKALYDQFKLNEPWNSEHNRKLLDKMPKVFAPPPGVEAKPGMTYLKVFTGPDTPFSNATVGPRMPASFQKGTSNNLLIVEASDPVEWTKPEDISYDRFKPVPALGKYLPNTFFAVLADGSPVCFDRLRLTDATLRAAITPAGNDIPGIDWTTARK
jgi:hypothetical protein